MTSKEALSQIKRLLFGDEKAMKNAKTEDGKILQWDGDLKEGTAVMVVDETGNMMPVEDATYTMEDGTKVTCVGGLVTALEGVKEEETEDLASEFEASLAKHLEDFSAFMQRFEQLEAQVKGYESKFTEMETIVTESGKTTDEKFAKVVELVEAIAAEPSVKQEKPKETFTKVEKPSWEKYLDIKK